jgi:hypothetical protein
LELNSVCISNLSHEFKSPSHSIHIHFSTPIIFDEIYTVSLLHLIIQIENDNIIYRNVYGCVRLPKCQYFLGPLTYLFICSILWRNMINC